MTRLRAVFGPVAGRLAFALLSAAILIVFSEKLYWYVTSYGVVSLTKPACHPPQRRYNPAMFRTQRGTP